MKMLLGAVVAAVLLIPAPSAQAQGQDQGDGVRRVTGVVSTDQEAALLPCDGVVAVCLPKQAARWSVDQVDGCTLRSDVTTAFRTMGSCVLDLDMGDHVKLWAPLGAVDEDFRLIWKF